MEPQPTQKHSKISLQNSQSRRLTHHVARANTSSGQANLSQSPRLDRRGTHPRKRSASGSLKKKKRSEVQKESHNMKRMKQIMQSQKQQSKGLNKTQILQQSSFEISSMRKQADQKNFNQVSYLRPVKKTVQKKLQIQNWTPADEEKERPASKLVEEKPRSGSKKKHRIKSGSKGKHSSVHSSNKSEGRRDSSSPRRKTSPQKNPPGSASKKQMSNSRKVGGYIEVLADQEANMISMSSLKEGEQFERDMQNMIQIIDSVERENCKHRLTNQFTRQANNSYKRRNIDMIRTIQAHHNYQHNFLVKQAKLKTRLNLKKQSDCNTMVYANSSSRYSITNQPSLAKPSGIQIDTADPDQNMRIRINRKRPRTTKNVFAQQQLGRSRLHPGVQQTSSHSGAFYFNKNGVNSQRDKRDTSEETAGDKMTSAVTAGNIHLPGLQSTTNFNTTQQASQGINAQGESGNIHRLNDIHSTQHEIFSDQTPVNSRTLQENDRGIRPQQSLKDNEFFAKNIHQFSKADGSNSIQNITSLQQERIASAKEFYGRVKTSSNVKSQLNVNNQPNFNFSTNHSGSPKRPAHNAATFIIQEEAKANQMSPDTKVIDIMSGGTHAMFSDDLPQSQASQAAEVPTHMLLNPHPVTGLHSRFQHLSQSPMNLADNMTINGDKQSQMSQTFDHKKLVMQVNKYIPHYQRIPSRFEKKDLEYLHEDHEAIKDSLTKFQNEDNLEYISGQIHNFDNFLLDTFMGDREQKYLQRFHQMDTPLVDDSSHREEDASSLSKKRKKQDEHIQKRVTATMAGYDSDEERHNAHTMFMEDIKALRRFFVKTVEEQVRIQEQMQEKFNKEREFFLESAQKGLNNTLDLENTIKQLQEEILEERDYSTKIFAEEQVSLLCQKALFSYKHFQKSQEPLISGLDMRMKPEGHVVVSKQEQDALLNDEEEPPRLPSSQASQSSRVKSQINPHITKSSLAPETHRQSQREHSLEVEHPEKIDSADDRQSVVSAIPAPLIEKHRMEVEDLKWQIQYEKKLQLEMTSILENKVSFFIAQVEELNKEKETMQQEIDAKDEENRSLHDQITKLEQDISTQKSNNLDLLNEIDDLKIKGGALSPVLFDKLNSKLNLCQTDNKQKERQIAQLETDLQRAVVALRDFHSRVVKLDQFTTYQMTTLQELVEQKIQEQALRIAQVTETFKDALMLTNKTYFLEEVTKLKLEKKKLKKLLTVAEDKIKSQALDLHKKQSTFNFSQISNRALITQGSKETKDIPLAQMPHIVHSQFVLDTNQLGGDQSPIEDSKANQSMRVNSRARPKDSSGRTVQENQFGMEDSLKSEASSRFKGSPKK